jgi:acetyl esterase/lipase
MKKCVLLFALILLGAPSALPAQVRPEPHSPAERPPGLSESHAVSIQQDVPYATVAGHPLLLDIYDPSDEGDLRPAVVLLHGGGFTTGDKSGMSEVAMFFAQSGFVAFSVDYRLTHGNENLWPAQLDDAQRAVRWIRAHATKYGVDRDRIGAYGYSAGAHLAALLGMEDTRDNSDPSLAKYSSRVEAVVDVSGPSDFTRDHDPDGDAFLTVFLGGDFARHADVWKDASPVFHVSRKSAPFLIVHGSHDENVPITQAQELAEKLKQAKVPVKLVTLDDTHSFHRRQSQRIAYESKAFFTQYLRLDR